MANHFSFEYQNFSQIPGPQKKQHKEAAVTWSLETIATLSPWFVVVPKSGGWAIEWDNGLNFYPDDRVLAWRGLTEFAVRVRDHHQAGLL